ncbi:MAG: HAMP domain-containing protein [Proteobacteria bacterium]|nr:HAMP domain-containing protein [Pseudomonadota bacterium]
MKKKTRLIWHLYPSYFIIICTALVAVSLYTSSFIEQFFLKTTEKNLLVRGNLLKGHIYQLLAAPNTAAVDGLCKQIGKTSDTRITIIAPDGTVIGDSEKNISTMDNHKNRPEILAALEGTSGSSIRDSETLRIKMMYVAMPILENNSVISVLRVSIPITSITQTIQTVKTRVMMVGFLVTVMASLLSLLISKLISKPIEDMKKGAAKFAEGDLEHRLHDPNISEFSGLASAMNGMAAQLKERIDAVKNQSNEFEAVLSSMSEGVIGIDRDENILNINQTAFDILKLSRKNIKGRSIQEVIRDPDFHKFVHLTVSSPKQEEDDFMIYDLGNSIINARSAPLKDSSDKRIGTLIVLNDVTQIRNLENIRKDFVANVSHEIRTPLTAIKGFVETLIGNDDETPENKQRFLGIIMKHVNRLSSILEDLLVLARIEQKNEEKENTSFELKNIREIIETALQVIQSKANEKKISIGLNVDDSLMARLDTHLIEQALVNLIDNAVKYSPENTSILISSGMDDSGGLFIRIEDHGQGIPEKHIQRIFERFYRVDKARSRNLGGTGLGLSIVKHIASLHGGHVSVKSIFGKGSTFSIHLPKGIVEAS